MTREEALLKLLRIEPETERGLAQVTGWPPGETEAVLRRLLEQGKVTYSNWQCQYGRRFYPA